MTARQEKLKRKRQAERARKMRNFIRTIARLILVALAELFTGYMILLIRMPVMGEVDGLGIILMVAAGSFTAMYLFDPDRKRKAPKGAATPNEGMEK